MSEDQEQPWSVAIQICVRILIAIIGVLGNGFVIYVIFKSPKLRDNTIKFIANLAVTDLVTVLAFTIYSVSIRSVKKSLYSCLITCLLVHYTIFASQFTLCITTIDRYFAICQHDKYAKIMTKKTVLILMVIPWIFPLGLVSIPFFGLNFWERIRSCECFNLYHEWIYKLYSTVVLIAVTINVVLYVRILLKAREFYRGFHPAQTVGINIASMRVRAKKRAIKNGRAIGMVTFIFIICWLPFHILQFGFGPDNMDIVDIAAIAAALGTFNVLVNPFLYAWQRRDFRKHVKKKLPCNPFSKETKDNATKQNAKSRPNAMNRDRLAMLIDRVPNQRTSAFLSKNQKVTTVGSLEWNGGAASIENDGIQSEVTKREIHQFLNYI